MEYLDIYDKNRQKTGKIIERGTHGLVDGEYVNLVLIFIKNSKNEYLIQKTSKEKGGVWATTGGHVKSGSDSHQTIIEEVNEELGLDITNDDFKLVDTTFIGHGLIDTYYLEKEIDINDIVVQEEEVEYVKWLTKDDIYKLIEEDIFRKGNIPGFEKVIELYDIFD